MVLRDNSPRLHSYCIFKHNYNTEICLSCIKESKYRIALARFRTSSHNLSIEKDRHINLTRDQRLCKSCNMKTIDSEYHFLLVCPTYRELRLTHFKPYFCHWPSLTTFESLLSLKSKKGIFNIQYAI